mmetsp:Transcript_9389/g.23920  ORF Transcript_9389/g.23920 Transcript_9389/m.23920 type:complete len:481 (+) Transcript_9389:168-1610(+)
MMALKVASTRSLPLCGARLRQPLQRCPPGSVALLASQPPALYRVAAVRARRGVAGLVTATTATDPGRTVAAGSGSEEKRAPLVVLKRGKSRLFRDGQPIVYSGAVDRVVGRPTLQAGDCVLVGDGAENVIGWGVFNPNSMFRVRIMQLEWEAERHSECHLDMEATVRTRLAGAAALRVAAGLPSPDTSVFRLCNSEGDRLSGLVVDVLGEVAVVASSAIWVERQKDTITECLTAMTGITSVVWRPNASMLAEEGLDMGSEAPPGEDAPDVEVRELGVRFLAAPGGQKTGFYADQRDNRAVLAEMCSGKRVLDLCCYSGGFGIRAALHGATHVTCVDSSEAALALGRRNAELNGVEVEFIKADIKPFMQEAAAAGHAWDVIILDPPKLAPNRKSLNKATNKYKSLNSSAMRLTSPGGLLLTCTCSGAMTQSGDFASVVHSAALAARRHVTVLREAGAGMDHPVSPQYPEGRYLTTLLVRVT